MNQYNIDIWYKQVQELFPQKLNKQVINVTYINPKPKELGAVVGQLAKTKGIDYALSIIRELDGTFFNVENGYVINTYRLPKKLLRARWDYHKIPPPIEPNIVVNWDECLLKGKHQFRQNTTCINQLQAVAYMLDPQVIIEETPQGIGDDTYRHDRVILDYLGQPFYFDWRYDARGRSYSIGWDINLQSDEYHKAMLSLANEELVTDEHALKIAIAGHAGQDKLSWGDRVAWFDDQEVFDTEYWPEPILGRKALRAYQECLDGIPSGYMMGIDATASGLQIMAVLSDCKETAVRVNLTGDDHRHDVYTHVANSMNNILNKRKVTRTDIKKPLMTMFYNSEAVPKQVLTKRQYKAFIESSKDLLPGPMAVMQLVNECFNPEAKQHKWVLPDGHVAVVDSSKTVQYNVVDEDYGKFHVHFKENRANKDQHRALAPNVIHSIDGWIAREMVRRTDFELVHIHDSFWFHPNNLNQVKQVYREILVDLNKMDLLRSIVKQLTGTDPGKLSKGKLAKHIKASSYALS